MIRYMNVNQIVFLFVSTVFICIFHLIQYIFSQIAKINIVQSKWEVKKLDNSHGLVTTTKDGDKTTVTVEPSIKGALAGASAGAAVGSAIPGIGTTTGAIAGGLIGFVFGPVD